LVLTLCSPRGWLQFALWAAAGAGAASGLLTALTVGIFVLLATVILTGLLIWRGDRRLAVPGVVTGLGLPLLYVGYLNRAGPGLVCTGTAANGSCTQEMSPWPWIAVGLFLVVTGAAIYLARSRHAGGRRGAP
jgi:hypothetical protein